MNRGDPLQKLVKKFKDDYAESTAKYEKLRNLDFFVLDNSIRESTVGQLRGHTLENKWAIYSDVKKMNFKNIIVASFSHMTRVDDVFIKDLIAKGEDPATLWAFSEMTDCKFEYRYEAERRNQRKPLPGQKASHLPRKTPK